MSAVTVTLAEADDLPALEPMFVALWRHMEAGGGRDLLADDGFERWCAGYGKARGVSRAIYIAHDGDAPAGFAEGVLRMTAAPQPPARAGHVAQFFVAPHARRGGVGSALHDAVREWFAARKASVETLDVERGNEGAARFWAARGFAPAYTSYIRESGDE